MPNDPQSSTREIGSAGLAISGGTVLEEWNQSITRIGANRLYNEMRDNDPVIGAVLFVIEYLLSQQPWHVDKGTGRRAKDAAKFLEECMKDMEHTWADFIQEALTMLQFGWSYHEIVYKRRSDHKLGWRKLPLRAQTSLDSWGVDSNNDITGMQQADYYLPSGKGYVFLPTSKCIHFRTTPFKNNPEGRSVLRSAVRPYMFVKRLQEIEAIGIERELAGLPVFYVPPDYLDASAPAAKRNAVENYRKQMAQIRRDERACLILPAKMFNGQATGFEFELASTGGKHAIDTNTVITRYEGRIATTMLAQFILLGMQGSGSFALADKQASVFTIALQSALNRIAQEINRKLIPDLMDLNGYEKNERPTLRAEKMQDVSLATLSSFVNQMVAAEVIRPDDELEDHLRKIADLPPKGKPRSPAENPQGAGRPNSDDPLDRDAAEKEQDPNDKGAGERANVRTNTNTTENA